LAKAEPDDLMTTYYLSVAHVDLGDALSDAGEQNFATEHFETALAPREVGSGWADGTQLAARALHSAREALSFTRVRWTS
jgi:hypothetical protein